jgi:aerotolerance regulator-like protein/VWA domain-containing protein
MTPILAFWQFGSAGMLAWGVAAALPIVIHLWSRRRYREQRWAAMAFLIAAMRKNARRIQLEQWILLALRTAILLLFALALADPHSSLFSGWTDGDHSAPTHLVVVVDGSYSMDYRPADKSRFEAAKELSKQLVAAGQQGDGYSLVVMADPPRTVIGQPSFEKRDVLQEIDNLELSHGGANLPATLAEIEMILRQAAQQSARNGRLAQRRVCIISDLQQATWGEVNSADCKARLGRLADLAALELVDLGQAGEGNLAVAALQIDSTAGGLPVVGSDIQIQAEIQSFARDDRRQPLEVLVDGQRIADQRIDCPAGGRTSFAVTHRFDGSGEHVVEAHLADDALPLDNRRWLSVPVRKAIRALCIGSRPGETMHLALALAPRKQSGQSIEVVQALESRLMEGDLDQFDCLLTCNIGRISRDEAAVLHRFVTRGGGLIVLLGDQVQPESYNQLLADEPQTRLLPGRIAEFAPTGTYAVDPLEYRHPIVAPFRGFPQSGLLTTPIWKYARVEPVDGAKTALALDNGDPLIVEKQVGRGRCILVSTAAAPDTFDRSSEPPTPWTALPTWPSFPPLVHEMLRLSLAGRNEGRNLLVGGEIAGHVTVTSADEPVALSGPGGLGERLPIRVEEGEGQWSFSPVSVSGVYEARWGSTGQKYAVNLNPRESDLTRLDAELLPTQLRTEPIPASAAAAAPVAGASAEHFRALLLAVLALLVIEPCLAWRFGRGRE